MSEERLIRIEDKLDKIVDRLGSVDITLAKQHDQLEYHIKRTNLLEAELRPVRDHVNMIKVAVKYISVIAVIVGIVKVFYDISR